MFLSLFLQSALIILVCMTILFLVATKTRNNSIIDIFWGPGFLAITLFSFLSTDQITAKKIILLCMVAVWGLRLSWHILVRNKGRGEDFRYLAWRKQWKFFYLRSYFQVFILQGTIMLIVASPLILVISSASEHTGVLELSGVVVFITGFLIESIADYQLKVFKASGNSGELMTSGLWQYSRHPNYFGEALLWWGIWLLSIPEINGLFTIISPVLITVLLRYVSGVPLLEKRQEKHPEWEEYKSKVPPFIPWIRK
jgi:steroid 5-alpha reductase family enzyme